MLKSSGTGRERLRESEVTERRRDIGWWDLEGVSFKGAGAVGDGGQAVKVSGQGGTRTPPGPVTPGVWERKHPPLRGTDGEQ